MLLTAPVYAEYPTQAVPRAGVRAFQTYPTRRGFALCQGIRTIAWFGWKADNNPEADTATLGQTAITLSGTNYTVNQSVSWSGSVLTVTYAATASVGTFTTEVGPRIVLPGMMWMGGTWQETAGGSGTLQNGDAWNAIETFPLGWGTNNGVITATNNGYTGIQFTSADASTVLAISSSVSGTHRAQCEHPYGASYMTWVWPRNTNGSASTFSLTLTVTGTFYGHQSGSASAVSGAANP